MAQPQPQPRPRPEPQTLAVTPTVTPTRTLTRDMNLTLTLTHQSAVYLSEKANVYTWQKPQGMVTKKITVALALVSGYDGKVRI